MDVASDCDQLLDKTVLFASQSETIGSRQFFLAVNDAPVLEQMTTIDNPHANQTADFHCLKLKTFNRRRMPPNKGKGSVTTKRD
jgi:hypothetical protein